MPENSSVRGRLDSWKEIADYLKRDTRTAIRWEQERGMPVHRVPGGKRQAVFAFTDEIDAWLLGQEPKDRAADDNAPPSRRVRSKLVWTLLVGTAFLVAVGTISFLLARPGGSSAVHPVGLKQLTDDGYLKQGLVTDGTTLYFGEHIGARLIIASAPANGGPVHRIETRFANVTVEDVSSDGTRLLIRSTEGIAHSGPLWVLPLSGGPPSRVGEVVCTAARWSPDNRKIACASGTTI